MTSSAGLPLSDAIGAFVLSALLMAAAGFSGVFERMLGRIPVSLASGMLAGVLLRFGLDVFLAMDTRPGMALTMFVVYLLGRRREVVDRANRAARAAGLDIVRSVFANMSVDLPRLFPRASVGRFHLNFPDPWWKSRQQKRRVVNPLLASDIHAALAPGGELFVETDIFARAVAMRCWRPRRRGRARFANAHAPWRFLPATTSRRASRREKTATPRRQISGCCTAKTPPRIGPARADGPLRATPDGSWLLQVLILCGAPPLSNSALGQVVHLLASPTDLRSSSRGRSL